MEKTPIGDLKTHVGEVVKLQGWLQTLRDQKSMQFLILRDRTGLVQIAHWKKGNPELAGLISTLGSQISPDSHRQSCGKRSRQIGRN